MKTKRSSTLIWSLICTMVLGNLLLADDNPYEEPTVIVKPKGQQQQKPVAKPLTKAEQEKAAKDAANKEQMKKLIDNPIRSVRILGEKLDSDEDLKALLENKTANIEMIYDLSQANCHPDAGRPCGVYFKVKKHVPNGPDVNLMTGGTGDEGLNWLDYNASMLKLFKEYNDLWKETYGENGVYRREGVAAVSSAIASVFIGFIAYKTIRKTADSRNRVLVFIGARRVAAQIIRTYKNPMMFGLIGIIGHGGSAVGAWRYVANPLLDLYKFGDDRQERAWLSDLFDTGACYAGSNLVDYAKGVADCSMSSAIERGRKGEKGFNFSGAAEEQQQEQNKKDQEQQAAGDAKKKNSSSQSADPLKPLNDNNCPEELKDLCSLAPTSPAVEQMTDSLKKTAKATGVEQAVMAHMLPRELVVGNDKVEFAEIALKKFFVKYRRTHKDIVYHAPSLRGSMKPENKQP